jgi:hypothetical protein
MKLRDAFLSKMMVIALLGTSFVQPSGAADLPPKWQHLTFGASYAKSSQELDHQAQQLSQMHTATGVTDADFHGFPESELVHESHGYHHEGYDGGLSPQHSDTHYPVYKETTKHDIQKMANQFASNPHHALDMIVKAANASNQGSGNGMANFKVVIKYTSEMPDNDVTRLELLPTPENSVVMQLTVHEAAKRNPLFLLDALMEVRNLYNLDSYTAYETFPVYAKKAHPSHHHKISHYHYINTSLLDLLGIKEVVTHAAVSENQITFSPIEYLEMRANAEAGSIFSKRRLQEMDNKNFHLVKYSLTSFAPMKKLSPELQKKNLIEYAKAKGIALSAQDPFDVSVKKFQDLMDLANKKQMDQLNAQAKITYKQQVDAYKADSAKRAELDKNKSLSDMIKANDRAGVADAMDVMLPWSIMEPTEKSFWTDFVDSIRHPNYDKAEILFRGLDADEKLQAVLDRNNKIVGGGLLSKRLTAGSGSHLFKLRGLPETFETFGTNGVNIAQWDPAQTKILKNHTRVSPLTQPHTLSKMMTNHSGDPAGSPFISLSYSLDTAFGFSSGKTLEVSYVNDNVEKKKAEYINSNASGGLATIRIDPRRLIINSISTYTGELEVLASMFVFPDEVIYLEKAVNYTIVNKDIPEDKWMERSKNYRTLQEEYYARARAVVYKKTGIIMPEKYQDVLTSGNKKFIDGIENMETLFNKANPGKPVRCEGVFK